MSESGELKYSDLVQGIPGKRTMRAGEVKRLVTRLNKLALILQASRSLMGAIDVKKLLSEILSKARSVMNADKASIFMIDEARGEIYASVTLDGSEIRLPRGSGIIGFVADSGETVNIADAYTDTRFNRDNDLKTGYRTRSILCMAVHNQTNKITGALQVLNKLDGDSFTHEDEELLSAFTAMVGVCLENARAYEELAAEKDSLEDKVMERTAELALAKAETDQILEAVEEGLFILYRSGDNFIIGPGYSLALTEIFGQKELRSKSFMGAITQFLEMAVVEKTRTFLELMFQPEKQQAVLLKLNPLAKVRARYADGAEKFLRFRFSRVMDSPRRVDHLLATVSDISHEIALQEKLERTEAENRRHMDLLLAILQSEPATLSEFLGDLDEDLALGQRLLRESGARTNVLLEVYRVVHSIKGNASLLNFQLLAESAHRLESTIDAYLARAEIGEAELQLITEQLANLGTMSQELRSWLQRISSFQTGISGHKRSDFLLRALQGALEKTAASQKKQAVLETAGFDPNLIAAEMRKPVKDMLIQLVRNAAVHGIEPPDQRQSAGKEVTGRVVLSSALTGNNVRIVVEDDGGGIDVGRVSRALLNQNRVTKQQLSAMTETEKLHLIFAPQVSTHEGVSELAGRGMGMSIVEEGARQMNAKITVESAKGKFTRFTIILPSTRESAA